jgi:hypothetical protein
MEIQEIKKSLSMLKVLAHYNLVPDRNNRLKCPFHDDTTPSFQVYPKTNTWHCFSSNCQAGSGDQIDFIMKGRYYKARGNFESQRTIRAQRQSVLSNLKQCLKLYRYHWNRE